MDAKVLVGWNLRRLRVERALTQEALGLLVECEPSYVGRIERGKENPTIGTLEAFAKALGVPISALFVIPKGPLKPLPTLTPGRKSIRKSSKSKT